MVGMLGAVGAGAIGGGAVSIVINAVDKFSKTFAAANAGMLALGAGITAVGVAGAVAVGGLLKMAGQFEQTQIAFTTMLGSAEEADKLLKELADFAARTPFTIPGIEQNAKMLLAMSIPLEDLLPTLKSLGDIASGLNVPMERLALNFGQVKVQGRLTGRELRDFSVAGVPLIAELAKNLGIAESAVKEMVSAGDIGFAEVEEAFKTMTSEGGKFFDLMDAQSKTFLGQVSNIQDSFIKVARTMGEVFLPAAKWVAEHLAILVGWFEEHPKLTKFAAATLGIVTALALIGGPLLILIGLLPLVVAGFATLSAVTLPMTATFLLIAAAIAGLIALFIWWDEIIVWFTKVFIKSAGLLDKSWQWFKDMFILGWAHIKNAAISGWNFLVDLYQKGVQKIFSYLKPVFSVINKASRTLGFGDIIDVSSMQKQIDSMSSLKGELEDIDALRKKLSDERSTRALEFEKVGNEMYEQIKLQRLGTEELEKQLEVSNEQNKVLTKQEQLVESLTGKWVIKSTGDIFDPTKGFGSQDFKSKEAYEIAMGASRGEWSPGTSPGVVNVISIENVNGLDPDEIAAALNDKLNTMIDT